MSLNISDGVHKDTTNYMLIASIYNWTLECYNANRNRCNGFLQNRVFCEVSIFEKIYRSQNGKFCWAGQKNGVGHRAGKYTLLVKLIKMPPLQLLSYLLVK
jgi:hypothetical protein